MAQGTRCLPWVGPRRTRCIDRCSVRRTGKRCRVATRNTVPAHRRRRPRWDSAGTRASPWVPACTLPQRPSRCTARPPSHTPRDTRATPAHARRRRRCTIPLRHIRCCRCTACRIAERVGLRRRCRRVSRRFPSRRRRGGRKSRRWRHLRPMLPAGSGSRGNRPRRATQRKRFGVSRGQCTAIRAQRRHTPISQRYPVGQPGAQVIRQTPSAGLHCVPFGQRGSIGCEHVGRQTCPGG